MGVSGTIIELYRRHGLAWAQLRGHALGNEAKWLSAFSAMLPEGGAVLDLGCGTGHPIAVALVTQGFRVTGADTAPDMLAVARRAMPEQEWLEQDMRSLALGSPFDGVLAWDSFFHLCHEDQRAMFPRFRDHCRSGAPLLFTSGPEHGEAIGDLEGEPLYHASLAPEEYRDMLASHGFRVLDHRDEDKNSGGRTVWLAQRI